GKPKVNDGSGVGDPSRATRASTPSPFDHNPTLFEAVTPVPVRSALNAVWPSSFRMGRPIKLLNNTPGPVPGAGLPVPATSDDAPPVSSQMPRSFELARRRTAKYPVWPAPLI